MTGEDGRLHPEGAPGISEQFARQVLGDSAFEAQRELQRKGADLAVRRYEMITALLSVAVFAGFVVAVSVAALVVLAVRSWW